MGENGVARTIGGAEHSQEKAENGRQQQREQRGRHRVWRHPHLFAFIDSGSPTLNSEIPFIKIADRVEVTVDLKGKRVSARLVRSAESPQ